MAKAAKLRNLLKLKLLFGHGEFIGIGYHLEVVRSFCEFESSFIKYYLW